MLNGKTVLLGVTGGIACYKAVQLCSLLVKAGANVRVMMTASAAKFVTPLTFQTMSRHHVAVDTFEEVRPETVMHIDWADSADLLVIAPATANMIGKLAHGLADDMVSTTALAATCPIFVAPAMNVHMFEHPAVQDNLATLRGRGVRFIEPGVGQLACGYVGKGRMAEPEDIVEALHAHARESGLLRGKRVVITAGGTVERIDPVRYISNDASGKMGFALAEAALRMGADVRVIAARTSAEPPSGAALIRAMSAQEMHDAVMRELPEADVLLKTAAVADYRPKHSAEHKIKKDGGVPVLELEPTPDILQAVGERKTRQFVVGFAAETEDPDLYAMQKLRRKRCDLLVANQVSLPGVGFYGDTNAVNIYGPEGLVEAVPLDTKRNVAERILRVVAERLPAAPEGDAGR